jgi:hypothetical protein
MFRIMWCFVCKRLKNFKKEKLGKGQGTVWYCRKCGTEK